MDDRDDPHQDAVDQAIAMVKNAEHVHVPEVVSKTHKSAPPPKEVKNAMERAMKAIGTKSKGKEVREWRAKMQAFLNRDEVVEYVQTLALSPGGKRILQKLMDKSFASPQSVPLKGDESPIRLVLGIQTGDGTTLNLQYAPQKCEVHDPDGK